MSVEKCIGKGSLNKSVMLLITVVLLLASKWYSTSATLPQLYYRLSSRRSVGVREFRRLERAGLQLAKVKLDINYFENCQELDLCPEKMKAKLPKLSSVGSVSR